MTDDPEIDRISDMEYERDLARQDDEDHDCAGWQTSGTEEPC